MFIVDLYNGQFAYNVDDCNVVRFLEENDNITNPRSEPLHLGVTTRTIGQTPDPSHHTSVLLREQLGKPQIRATTPWCCYKNNWAKRKFGT
jgi:hypothetical protein